MSLARLATASAVALAALVAVSGDARAAVLDGGERFGKDYSASTSSGKFGASVDFYAEADMQDYAKLCASTKPAVMCAGMTGANLLMCTYTSQAEQLQFCSKTGYGFGASAGASSDVTLFGKDIDLFDLSAGGRIDPKGTSVSYNVQVGGATLRSGNSPVEVSKNIPLAGITLGEVETTIMLGIIPVTVTSSAVGSLELDISVDAASSSLTGYVTPSTEIDGIFSAGVGVADVSVGIEGTLDLVNVSMPAHLTVGYQGNGSFDYDAGLDLTVAALDGSIDLYAQAGSHKSTLTIVSWDGLHKDFSLGDAQGTYSFVSPAANPMGGNLFGNSPFGH